MASKQTAEAATMSWMNRVIQSCANVPGLFEAIMTLPEKHRTPFLEKLIDAHKAQ